MRVLLSVSSGIIILIITIILFPSNSREIKKEAGTNRFYLSAYRIHTDAIKETIIPPEVQIFPALEFVS